MIIDECGRILATPVEREGREGERESVAGAALLALQMVESALEKQEAFFSLIRQVGESCDSHVISGRCHVIYRTT